MNHFAEQKNPLSRVFINRAIGNLDRLFDAVAKPEMSGKEEPDGSAVD
jgi:hypothetical protein